MDLQINSKKNGWKLFCHLGRQANTFVTENFNYGLGENNFSLQLGANIPLKHASNLNDGQLTAQSQLCVKTFSASAK